MIGLICYLLLQVKHIVPLYDYISHTPIDGLVRPRGPPKQKRCQGQRFCRGDTGSVQYALKPMVPVMVKLPLPPTMSRIRVVSKLTVPASRS